MEAICRGRGSGSLGIDRGFNSATIQPRFGGGLASILLQNNHDRTTIAPQSRRDRAMIVRRS